MDRAYEGNETRQLLLDLGMIPVVPPKSNRLHPLVPLIRTHRRGLARSVNTPSSLVHWPDPLAFDLSRYRALQ
jgi:hypothetical protein